jgi:hypothetical protein
MTEAASAGRYYEIFDVFADKALAEIHWLLFTTVRG